jgi:hypothetical protein
MVPQEAKNPVTTSLEGFFNDVKTGGKPKADYMIGLHDSATVCLANKAMDEERRVLFSELESPANGSAVPAAAPKKRST